MGSSAPRRWPIQPRRRMTQGSSGAQLECVADLRNDVMEGVFDLVIGEPEGPHIARSEPRIAQVIVVSLRLMCRAVDLDGESAARRVEVENEAGVRMLSTKLYAEPPPAKLAPQNRFCGRRRFPQRFRAFCHRCLRAMIVHPRGEARFVQTRSARLLARDRLGLTLFRNEPGLARKSSPVVDGPPPPSGASGGGRGGGRS